MKTFILKVRNMPTGNVGVFADGEAVTFKRNQFGSLEGIVETENESVEIKICKYHELNAALWYIMSVFFFIISFFGLLEPHYDRTCTVADCVFTVKPQNNSTVSVVFNSPSVSGDRVAGAAIKIETDCEHEVFENSYRVDEVAKRRSKILWLTRVLIWIAAVGALILILYKVID